MSSGTVTAEFPADAKRVWEIITDIESTPSWVPDLVSVKSLGEGPLSVGSRFAQVMRVQGRKIDMVVTITELEQPRRIAHTGEGGSVKIGGSTTIVPVESGCRVTNDWTLELSGLLRFASPIAGNWTRNNIEGSMKALRMKLEAEPGSAV